MSVIFGVLKPERQLVQRDELLDMAATTERYALDGTFVHEAGRIGMGLQPLHTTARSRLKSQPTTDQHGNMLVFDGRLDNHRHLAAWLDLEDPLDSDPAIVLAAFSRWGEGCFVRMIGDWSLALWSRTNQELYLARDHAGTRTLFFQSANGVFRWSTYLDTFLAQTSPLLVDENFAAAFLCSSPIRELTPYRGICAVPPAHYAVIRNSEVARRSHWQWVPEGMIRHNSDGEYEEHFLSLFRRSVARRTECEAPILAELSGGMDSTSIVCMSDQIRRSSATSGELLDTISFYDDSEPSWDERSYFSITEARRGKTGLHIAASFADIGFSAPAPCRSLGYQVWPVFGNLSSQLENKFQHAIKGRSYRVILSGIGGDELLGGVPTPLPELADHLVSANLVRLLRRAVEWSIANRTSLLHELFEVALFAARLYWPFPANRLVPPLWVHPTLRCICRDRQREDIAQATRVGACPSAMNRGQTWWDIMETLPHLVPGDVVRPEYRYPYLDRDLVDFLFHVPPEQLVRPGRRRSLMRRALKNIVPIEVLERRRKGYLARGPLVALQNAREDIQALFEAPVAGEYGFIDPLSFRPSIDLVTSGKDMTDWPVLVKAIAFELWLRANAGRLETPHKDVRCWSSCSRVSGHTRSAGAGTHVVAARAEI